MMQEGLAVEVWHHPKSVEQSAHPKRIAVQPVCEMSVDIG
jgi:hypothetical protein